MSCKEARLNKKSPAMGRAAKVAFLANGLVPGYHNLPRNCCPVQWLCLLTSSNLINSHLTFAHLSKSSFPVSSMFGFPVAPRIDGFKLQQNLLRTVVFQVKFPSNFEVLSRQSELQETLKDSFPIFQELKIQDLSFEIVDQTPIVSSQQGSTGAFEFRAADQQKIFTIKEDELTLTILGPQYVNFQTVQQDLRGTIYRIADILGLTVLTRTAIRKINLVNFQRNDSPLPYEVESIYRTVFQNLLTLTSAAIPAAKYLFSGISNYRYHNDAHRLNLVYGLLPELAADGARQFVLDIDLINMTPNQPYADLSTSFAAINDEVFNVFSWSINQSLIDMLNNPESYPAA